MLEVRVINVPQPESGWLGEFEHRDLPARFADSRHFGQSDLRHRNVSQAKGDCHRLECIVFERKLLSVRFHKVDLLVGREFPLAFVARDFKQFRAEIAADHPRFFTQLLGYR